MGKNQQKIEALVSVLKKSRRVGIDSNICIYLLDRSPQYFDKVAPVFHLADNNKVSFVTSTFSYLEAAVGPLKHTGDPAIIAQIKYFFTDNNGLEAIAPGLDILDLAVVLRAQYNIRTIDAIQVATAMQSRCPVFLTNDRGIKQIEGIRIEYLDDYS